MMVRTGLVALSLLIAAPLSAQAQVIDLGRGGPQIDLRNGRQRERDFQREQARRDMYRRDSYRGSRYDRDDLPTGSIRRYDDRRGYVGGGYDRRDRW